MELPRLAAHLSALVLFAAAVAGLVASLAGADMTGFGLVLWLPAVGAVAAFLVARQQVAHPERGDARDRRHV